jgi:Domain of unknown function (DUF4126)
MDALRIISTLLPLAVSSGINLYATVLIAGLCIRFGWIQNTPAGLDVLAAWPVLVVAALCYGMEFLADKIQFVDNLWDLIHTVIRPLGAALIGIAALGKADPLVVVLGSLAMGGVALVSHAGKAGSRVALNVVSPAENVSNIGVSLGEDIAAGALTVTALKYPLVAGALALLILLAMILLVPRLLRWAWFVLNGVGAWLRGGAQAALKRPLPADTLPPLHAALLGDRRTGISVRGKAQNIRKAGGRTGYLSMLDDGIAFTYDTHSRQELWSARLAQIAAVRLRRRALMEVIEVRYFDDKHKARVARFAFLKDRSRPAEELTAQLAGRLPRPETQAPLAAGQAAGLGR